MKQVILKERVLSSAGQIIINSFPLLKNKKIRFFVMRFKFYACSIWIPPLMRFIIISKRTKDFSDSALEGILAHELCHQERYLEMGIKRYLKFAVGFITSRKVQANEERATDMLTIEKGYGKQLYELSKIQYLDKKHKRINENYLSLEEIKTYSERIGKF
jgi:hypothetical protein